MNHPSRRTLLVSALAWAAAGPAAARMLRTGHGDAALDPAMPRFTGTVTALPAASEGVVMLAVKPFGSDIEVRPDVFKGWRMTVLTGQRFSSVYGVAGNTREALLLDAGTEALSGIAIGDVFVLENPGANSL